MISHRNRVQRRNGPAISMNSVNHTPPAAIAWYTGLTLTTARIASSYH